jgi:hypothetical protein
MRYYAFTIRHDLELHMMYTGAGSFRPCLCLLYAVVPGIRLRVFIAAMTRHYFNVDIFAVSKSNLHFA